MIYYYIDWKYYGISVIIEKYIYILIHVCHIWIHIYHQYTPVLLAYISYMDPSWVCISMGISLVGGLEHFFIFPHIGKIIIPIDFHIFQWGSSHQPDGNIQYYSICIGISIIPMDIYQISIGNIFIFSMCFHNSFKNIQGDHRITISYEIIGKAIGSIGRIGYNL